MSIDFENEFKTRKQQHFTALKESYKKLVEAAYDKEYASRAYAKSLFDPILDWKNDSDYFRRVLGLLVHFSKLDPSNVMKPIFENLQPVKDLVADSLPIFEENDPDSELELYFMALDEIQLVDHLAQFVAAFDLSKEFSPNKDEQLGNAKVKVKEKQHCFTRNQQLLALYYTLKATGIEPRRTTDMTNYTRFIHLLAGVDFTKVQNDIFYSKVKDLPNILTDQYLKKDLEFIRSYFVNIGAQSIIAMIDLEINGCSD